MQKTNLVAFNPIFGGSGPEEGTEGLDHRALSKKVSSMNSILNEGDDEEEEAAAAGDDAGGGEV